jgi:hypothetical protein
MLAGDRAKTNNYTIDYWWLAENANRDLAMGNPVASWIGKNARVLDKKRAPEVIQLLVEQFAYLQAVEARHIQFQSAKWTK